MPAMGTETTICRHHWRLEGQNMEADGTCLHCGERRRFTGGIDPEALNLSRLYINDPDPLVWIERRRTVLGL